jgi:hypothetical protein
VFLVVVFCYFDARRGGSGLEGIGGDVVLVVGNEGKRESGTEGGSIRKEKARILMLLAILGALIGSTYRLTPRQQTRSTGFDAKRPYCPHTICAGSLLP